MKEERMDLAPLARAPGWGAATIVGACAPDRPSAIVCNEVAIVLHRQARHPAATSVRSPDGTAPAVCNEVTIVLHDELVDTSAGVRRPGCFATAVDDEVPVALHCEPVLTIPGTKLIARTHLLPPVKRITTATALLLLAATPFFLFPAVLSLHALQVFLHAALLLAAAALLCCLLLASCLLASTTLLLLAATTLLLLAATSLLLLAA